MTSAVSFGGTVVRFGGVVPGVTVPVVTTPPTYALFADIADPGWVQAPAVVPSLSVTLIGGTICYVQLTRFGVAVGSAVSVASGAVPSGLPQMATPGMYTVRAFADAGLTTKIGESGVIQAWASASGPASAAVTIDSASVPAQPLDGKVYTITGTAVTSNNYVNVALGYNGGQSDIFPAEVTNGVWSQTRAWFGSNRNTLTVTDPSTGQQAVVTTQYPIPQTGEFSPNLMYSDNYYSQPVFTTASVDTGYDAGEIRVSFPASWGTLTTLTVNPIAALLCPPTNYGNSSFVRIRIDGQQPVPARYTITASCSFSSHATVTLSLPEWFVPYSQPPTQAKLTLDGPVTDLLPAYTVVGRLSNTNAANQVNFRSKGSFFFVPLDNNLGPDGNAVVTYQDNIPAGSYTFQTRSVQGNLTAWTTHTITVAATTAATISFTPPTGVTNRSAPGTSLGTPTTNMTGTVTWRVRTDRGYRVAIDKSTGALTVARYLSACSNGLDAAGERFDLVATNGTQTATLSVFIPVAFPIDITCHVGSGQQYSTFQAFWSARIANAAAWGAGNIRLYVHPGTYTNDLGATCGRVYTNLWVTGIRDGNGKLPLITSTEPASFADTKGYFNVRGMDLIVEGVEIAHARINAYKSEFLYGICMDDSVGPAWVGACELRDFVMHDCDDGIGRGNFGARSYCHHGVMAYGPDGTGYGHCIYALGTLLDVRHVLLFGGSNGHLIKSRCDTTIIDDCTFAPLNNASPGSLIDLCNGGNNTVTNCRAWLGPNINNPHLLEVAAEAAVHGNQLALGNRLKIAGNFFYNLLPREDQGLYYTAGHQQGVALAADWLTPDVLPFGLPPIVCDVHDNTIIGFADDRVVGTGGYSSPIPLGANNTISRLGTIPSGASYLQPANWPLLTAVPGFTDSSVGPTYRPSLDNGVVVGTQWMNAAGTAIIQEFSAATPVGTVIAYAFTAAKSYENSDQGPFTYTLAYMDNAHTGLCSVTSNGHLVLALDASGMANQIVLIYVNAVSSSTGNLNPMGASMWIRPP